MARDKKGSIDGLKNKLYSRNEETLVHPEERTPLSTNDIRPPVRWQEKEAPTLAAETFTLAPRKKKSRMSLPTKFFIGCLVFFAIAAGVAGYMFFAGGNSISPQNIDLQVVMPSVIDGGKATNMQILINNHNAANLKLVDLVLTYPNGTRDPANPNTALTHERQSIGDINSGQTVQRTAQAIFYGQEGQTQQVSVQLEYSVEGSNAVFEKDSSVNFTVGSSPISISVAAPTEAISEQQFSMDLTVQSNALAPVNDVVIQAQYPFGYTFGSASPAPAIAGGTLWRLGTMKPGDTKVIHVTGSLDGQDGDTRVFYFLAGSDSDHTDTQIKVPFLSVPQTLTVRHAFITGTIAINGDTAKTVSAPAGQAIQGVITWTNNLPDPVSDVQISLSLKGPTLDTSSISSSNGFYQSSNSTITWSKDQVADLGTVPPGGTGILPFTFSLLPTGAGGTLYSNPAVNLNLTVQAVRTGQGNVPETVSSAATTQVQVSSAATLAATATHFSGPFTNTGPMPPVAEQKTTYGIVWTVTNTSNTIANSVVSATLPTYVSFVVAAAGSGVTYNSSNRTVTWAMGDVDAGVGFTKAARTAAFQVAFTPSSSQVGQSPALTSPASLSGQDRFAQVQVTAQADAPTIQITNDSGYNTNMGVVAPKQ